MASIHQRKIWHIDGATTPESAYLTRRTFLGASAATVGLASLGGVAGCAPVTKDEPRVSPELIASLIPDSGNMFIKGERNARYTLDRAITDEPTASSYNNFYEFTTSKTGVWRLAQKLTIRPWTIEVTGEVANPMTFDYDDIVRKMPVEERLYRFRCVEAWAMAVPWMGFPLKALLEYLEPTSKAKFVRMVTFQRPEEAVGQNPPTSWQWPYHEALTMEEAVNELTFMAIGIYGHEMPKQHGAPLRLIVPWKYGYKSIKSVVRIELTETRPPTFWNDAVPDEYSWTSNVDPNKPHPRWSQATERIIDTGERLPTLPYNGYGDYVHDLYKGTSEAAL